MTASIASHELGISWTIDETMQRSSHALVEDGRVWLVDPVEDEAAIEQAAGLGQIAGVVQLLDRHNRDCAKLATRFGVPHERPSTGLSLDGSGLRPFRIKRAPRWHEYGLWGARHRALVVPEAVGTIPFFTLELRPVGMHPLVRMTPPRVLRDYSPQHLLVGHGAPIHGQEAAAALHEALRRSRREIPRFVVSLPRLVRSPNPGREPA